MTWDDLTCALKCEFVCDEIFLRHTFILTLFTKLGCLDMVMLNAYIVLETVNLNTMYLKNVNGFVDMWGVFSMKPRHSCDKYYLSLWCGIVSSMLLLYSTSKALGITSSAYIL